VNRSDFKNRTDSLIRSVTQPPTYNSRVRRALPQLPLWSVI